MIGRLVGNIIECSLQQLLLDVGGVGYEVEIPLSTYYQISDNAGPIMIYTHLVVRDDAHLLFGFGTLVERDLFRALIKVNSVGPKLALVVLSGLDGEALAKAISERDVKTLTALPGVGKKTAEKIIIDLQDRLSTLTGVQPNNVVAIKNDVAADVESALIGLGYKPQEAARAIALVQSPAPEVENLLKQALKQLMNAR